MFISEADMVLRQFNQEFESFHVPFYVQIKAYWFLFMCINSIWKSTETLDAKGFDSFYYKISSISYMDA